MMLGKRSTGVWVKQGEQAVTLFSGQHIATASVGTVKAYNYFAELPTLSTSLQGWVALSNNGFGWVVIAAEC